METAQVDNPIRLSAQSNNTQTELLRGLEQGSCKRFSIELLRDEYLDEAFIGNLARDYEALTPKRNDPDYQGAMGALGAVLAAKHAERAFFSRDFSKPNQLLKAASVSQMWSTIFDVPQDHRSAAWSFVDCGSTSYIVKGRTQQGREIAIKCIQPRYFDLSSVGNATSQYQEKYGHIESFAPYVFACSPKWVIMDYLESISLDEFIRRNSSGESAQASKHSLSRESVDQFERIATQILNCLLALTRLPSPVSHLDLSPRNILLVSPETPNPSVRLIDFGKNYILSERVGPASHYADVFSALEIYIAPELASTDPYFSPLADLYSFGVISLEMLSGKKLRREELGGCLAELWSTWPQIAQLIEELIEEGPERRLLLSSTQEAEGLIRYVQKQVSSACEIYREVLLKTRAPDGVWGFVVDLFRGPSWERVVEIARLRSKSLRGNDPAVWGAQYIAAKALVSVSMYYIVFWAFIYTTAVDMGMKEPVPLMEKVASAGFLAYSVGDFWTNVWGRLVALSFGLIATKYYLNICSQLFVTHVKSKWTPIAELTLLLNTFSYAPAILWAMLYNPRDWPYCVFVGILFVVANNLVLYRLTREAHVAGRSTFTSEKRNSSESFVRKFRPWARQMFIYDCFVLGAGLLLAFKIAQDEPIYAIFAVSMNLFQIYAIVLTREAPVVRTGLSRLIFLHRRLDRTAPTKK